MAPKITTKSKKTAAAETETQSPTVEAIKGFDDSLACRGFAYAVGGHYRHDGEVKICERGFHAVEGHPLDVFSYYPPAHSRYARVTCGGTIQRNPEAGDSKIASAEITIKAELRLPELIEAAVKYVLDRVTWIAGSHAAGEREAVRSTQDNEAVAAAGRGGAATASGAGGAATASGNRGAATASGDWGAATASGNRGAATASGTEGAATASGWRGAATASGYQGAATASGDWGAATASGVGGAATASGYQGAATASGTEGAATASGAGGAATASGWWGAATASGERGAATASGEASTAHASGPGGKVRGAEGTALHLDERSGGAIVATWAGIVGRAGIKPMTWYRLEGGKPVEVTED